MSAFRVGSIVFSPVARERRENDRAERFQAEALRLQNAITVAMQFLGAALSGTIMDPSWIRPRPITLEDRHKSVAEAYGVLHDAINGGEK